MAEKKNKTAAAPKVSSVSDKHLSLARNHAGANPQDVSPEGLLARLLAVEEKISK